MPPSNNTPAVTHAELVAVLDTVRELSALTLDVAQKLAERVDMVINAQAAPAQWFSLRGLGRSYQSVGTDDVTFDSQTRNLGRTMREFDRARDKLVSLVQKLEANAAKAA